VTKRRTGALRQVARLPVKRTHRKWPWATVAIVGGLALGIGAFASPVKAVVRQENLVKANAAELRQLQAETQRLHDRYNALQTPQEIERIARTEYGMVRPGQLAYTVVIPTAPALPPTWPFNIVRVALAG
jgi:cell division protein FtsB